MALVTYTPEVEARMRQREQPPRTSYLDLRQLQAYWSPERLNHHTAPTSLVYGLREALRLLHEEGIELSWARHARVARALEAGLRALELRVSGGSVLEVSTPSGVDALEVRSKLRDDYGIDVNAVDASTWRVGLLGADATLANVLRLVGALESVLRRSSAGTAAARAYAA
jgi:aspartate aminotransferase-like enzyme